MKDSRPNTPSSTRKAACLSPMSSYGMVCFVSDQIWLFHAVSTRLTGTLASEYWYVHVDVSLEEAKRQAICTIIPADKYGKSQQKQHAVTNMANMVDLLSQQGRCFGDSLATRELADGVGCSHCWVAGPHTHLPCFHNQPGQVLHTQCCTVSPPDPLVGF